MGIKFYKVHVFESIDPRRLITDVTLPENVEIPFGLTQFKTITLSDKAVEEKSVVGNHYHTEESNRWEFFVAVGKENIPLFKFRFREQGGKIQEKEMEKGDACLIPPTISHSFLPLVKGVQIFGIANLKYDSEHDVTDKLF
ncbi:hypothetical protein KA005_21090 [bacterium]|nr:hypothetical protein [bacterium]